MSVVAVVLAAGAGSRFSGSSHKLLALVNGLPVVEHAIQAAVDSGIGDVVVVTGAVDLSSVLKKFPDLIEVHNEDWQLGQAVSIQCALHSLGAEVDRVVIGLGDQPGVTPDAWRAVAADQNGITVATYSGVRGNPVGLSRDVWKMLPIDGDEGARKVMKMHPELVNELPCLGSSEDIDTEEDLRRWN